MSESTVHFWGTVQVAAGFVATLAATLNGVWWAVPVALVLIAAPGILLMLSANTIDEQDCRMADLTERLRAAEERELTRHDRCDSAGPVGDIPLFLRKQAD